VELTSYVIVAGAKSQVASGQIESVLLSAGDTFSGSFSRPWTSRLFWLSPEIEFSNKGKLLQFFPSPKRALFLDVFVISGHVGRFGGRTGLVDERTTPETFRCAKLESGILES
jgi:hypothetical protein